MLPYLVAFGLLAHFVFWGAGLAILAMPRPWSRFWPVATMPAGALLQSLVVWVGAFMNLRGTHSYGLYTEIVPIVLLGVGLWVRRAGAFREFARFGAVGAATVVTLIALVRPLTQAASGLTTASLGNCDAGDYAAGARVLMDFAHSDRSGFLGLTDVVQGILSTDNFFDFWLKLNHFTPSALIALNGTIFHCAPYEIISLLTMALLAAVVPIVFWVARAVMGHGIWASVGIATLFGLSPVMWYAAYEVAIGQLLAASAIGLITWAGVALWRSNLDGRRSRSFAGILVIGFGLIFGSYNFIVIVCLVPAVAYAGGLALWTEQWRRFGRWLAAMVLPLAIAGVIFWDRVVGITERFRLFATFDFGWHIPALSPEGWFGIVTGPELEPWPGLVRLALALAMSLAIAEACRRGIAKRDRRVFLVACMTAPVLIGYGYLEAKGWRMGTNASYNAYKLFTVFYPVILPALFIWAMPGRIRWNRPLTLVLASIVALGSLIGIVQFAKAMSDQPLVVDKEMAQLQRIEAMPIVDSINMRVGTSTDMWARLWANSFLLKKPQYFETDTYEARWHTPLRGSWDLDSGLVSVHLPDNGSIVINRSYTLDNVSSPYYLRAELGKGWYGEERQSRSSARWRWTEAVASVKVDNPQDRSLQVVLSLDGSSLVDRDLEIWLKGKRVSKVHVGMMRSVVVAPAFEVPTGLSLLELRSNLPATPGPGGDSRKLQFNVSALTLEVRPQAGEFSP